jgi:hypothetical protein
VDGTLNNPADTDRGWSVEIAFPFKGLATFANGLAPPHDGDQWRMGFSRVEWLIDIIDGTYRKIPKEMRPEDNWVWSPQGVIDMHRPERWGYVQFTTGKPGTVVFRPDPSLPARDLLMDLYYREKAFFKRYNRYTESTSELGFSEKDLQIVWLVPLWIRASWKSFYAIAMYRGGHVIVDQDSKLSEGEVFPIP